VKTQPQASPPKEIYARRQLAAIAKRWDQKAKAWERELEDPACHLNEDEAYERFLRQVGQVIHSRRAFCACQGVIDTGCGTGLVLKQVISSFAWGVGVDISEEMIRMAEAKRLANARFIVGDCFRLPDLCPNAGAVISRGVLLSHYGPEQAERLLHAARTSLVPGGFAIFDFLNDAARDRYGHRPEEKAFFTGKQVQAMARRAGFNRARVLGEKVRRVLMVLAEV
jgi:predicted TPR repeat methyltransferase